MREIRTHGSEGGGREPPYPYPRHLAAIRKFCQWSPGTGRIRELLTEGVQGVVASPTAPRWLPKRDVAPLLRAAERESSLYEGKRNLALILFLRHPGCG